MSRAWIRRVSPVQLHGFQEGELVLDELEPGLNVVCAPNATGKSTLAKAIGLLFDPTDCDKETLVLGLVASQEEQTQVTSQKKAKGFPGFPGRAQDYRLDLVELMSGFKKDQSPLDKEIGGGREFTKRPSTAANPLNVVKEAAGALAVLRQARRDKEAVADVEDLLPEREVRVAEAIEARDVAAALEALERRAASAAELDEKRKVIERMRLEHPGLELQEPAAKGHAAALRSAIDRARAGLDTATKALRLVVEDGRLPDRPLSELDQATLARLLDEVNLIQGEIDSTERTLAGAQTQAVTTRETILRLSPEEDADSLPLPEAGDLGSLSGVAAQMDSARRRDIELQAYEAMCREWSAKYPVDENLEKAAATLLSWLASESSPSTDRRPLLLMGLVAVASIALAAIPLLEVRAAVAAAVVIAAVILLRLAPVESGITSPDVSAYVAGVVDHASVAEALEKLFRSRAGLEVASQLEARSKLPREEVDWRALAAHLRLKCQDPYALAAVANGLQAYLDARQRVREGEERLQQLLARMSAATESLRDLYKRYKFPCPPGMERQAAPSFKAWFDRSAAVRGAEESVAQSETALGDHFARNGLPGKDLESALRSLVEREPLALRFGTLTLAVARLEQELENKVPSPPRLAAVLGGRDPEQVPPDETRALKEEQTRISRELDQRQKLAADARAEIANAEKASIPASERAYHASLAKVEVRWQGLVRQAVRSQIERSIQEHLRTEELPPVVLRAGGYLSRFTGDRYRLELGGEQIEGLGLLLVRDVASGKLQRFDELSTGTKVHSVIALRLALISEQEQKVNGGTIQFPLIADEALAVSDPEASRAITEALVQISRERQVIVFTHQPQDAELFQRLDRRMKRIDLGSTLPDPLPVPRSRRAVVRAGAAETAEQPPLTF